MYLKFFEIILLITVISKTEDFFTKFSMTQAIIQFKHKFSPFNKFQFLNLSFQ